MPVPPVVPVPARVHVPVGVGGGAGPVQTAVRPLARVRVLVANKGAVALRKALRRGVAKVDTVVTPMSVWYILKHPLYFFCFKFQEDVNVNENLR